MVAKITPTAEQQSVLAAAQSTIVVVNDRGVPTHVVLPIEEARRVYDDHARRALTEAFDEADREPLESWDIEATLAEARRRHQSGPS